MKIVKNLYVTCSDMKERQNVFSVLQSLGYKSDGCDGEYLNIQTDRKLKEWYTWTISEKLIGTEELTYTKFMEKYAVNELQTKVNEALIKGYTNATLSEALGNHRNYIARLLKMKHKEETVNRVIQEIDILLGNKVIVDASVLKELDHKNQVLDKRNSLLLNAEEKIETLQAVNAVYVDNISELNNDNQALSSMRIAAENKLHKERTISAVVIIGLLLILGFITFIH